MFHHFFNQVKIYFIVWKMITWSSSVMQNQHNKKWFAHINNRFYHFTCNFLKIFNITPSERIQWIFKSTKYYRFSFIQTILQNELYKKYFLTKVFWKLYLENLIFFIIFPLGRIAYVSNNFNSSWYENSILWIWVGAKNWLIYWSTAR